MPSTKIQMKATGLTLLEENKWELYLDLVDSEDVSVKGADADLPAFKKLLGKTVDARLSVGADEEQPAAGSEQLAAQLQVEKAMTDDLRKQLDAAVALVARVEKQRDEAKEAAAAAAPDVDLELVRIARGHLQVVKENAEKHMNGAKSATDTAKWGELVRTAREGLRLLELHVGTNGTPPAQKPQLPLNRPAA